jgi:hypothetical protein
VGKKIKLPGPFFDNEQRVEQDIVETSFGVSSKKADRRDGNSPSNIPCPEEGLLGNERNISLVTHTVSLCRRVFVVKGDRPCIDTLGCTIPNTPRQKGAPFSDSILYRNNESIVSH